MKIKNFLLTSVFLVLVLIAYVVASLHFCYTTQPEVTTGEFPFSITYEYKGETKKLSGVFECEFSGSRTILSEHSRFWNGYTTYDNVADPEHPNVVDQSEYMVLGVHENMSAGYFMGDPLYKDHYNDYGLDGPQPSVEYYDYTNEISLNEDNREELQSELDFRIIDFTYPEQIENSFSNSGISYASDNIMIFVMILLAFLVLCIVFVRKDKEYTYTPLDKMSIIFNVIVGVVGLPFITLVCCFIDIVGGGDDIISQISYNIPSITILGLALSIVFRRKGMSKTGFFMQFIGVVLFVLYMVIDTVL